MKRTVKVGVTVLLGIAVVAVFTLRLTGFEPQYLDPSGEEFKVRDMTARPGFRLTGEVVTAPVTDWSFVNKVNDPVRKNTIMLETRTRYFIPHSVTTAAIPRGDKLYIGARSDEKRLRVPFPHDKAWTANVARDPRVRLKIGGNIYEMTLVLITDRAEVAALMGRDPVMREKGAGGQERITAVQHFYRAFQRNIAEYDGNVRAEEPNR